MSSISASKLASARIAVTLGDPAGVGAEVALRALTSRPRPKGSFLLVGDPGSVEDAAARIGLAMDFPLVDSEAAAAGEIPTRGFPILLPAGVAPLKRSERKPGKPTLAGARMAYASLLAATGLALARRADAIVTAPLSKEWLARAQLARTGHTEILAKLTGAKGVRLMMVAGDLRVVLVTSHMALRDVPAALDIAGVRETIAIAHRHLKLWWDLQRPKVAVAALNPHAGDGGVYGDEEDRILAPAIRKARASRINAFGPVPADALFSAMGPEHDAVVALYHDQGLIPIKQKDVHGAVNVTLGLPFVRTSPDHGTAFDRAGKAPADPRSMRAAIQLAMELAPRHRPPHA
jgi:4-hydroxythreonine-4-phosphate dehydrogenase